MRASIYAEYVEHKGIPCGKLWITLRGKRMVLSRDGWEREFANREVCMRWLVNTYPDGDICAFSDGVTLCAGSVLGVAGRAGIHPEPAPLFAGGAS